MSRTVQRFGDAIFEGYNAKLPEGDNAYKEIDAKLKSSGFSKKSQPTAKPEERRFMYFKKNGFYVIVTAYFAGGIIHVTVPSEKTEARLSCDVLNDFIDKYIMPNVKD